MITLANSLVKVDLLLHYERKIDYKHYGMQRKLLIADNIPQKNKHSEENFAMKFPFHETLRLMLEPLI